MTTIEGILKIKNKYLSFPNAFVISAYCNGSGSVALDADLDLQHDITEMHPTMTDITSCHISAVIKQSAKELTSDCLRPLVR